MSFKQDYKLELKIDRENYIKDLQALFNKLSNDAIVLTKKDTGDNELKCCIEREIREKIVQIQITVCFDEKVLKKISLELIPEEGDNTNYCDELKLFYYEVIKEEMFDAVTGKKNNYTLRCYKKIYNSIPLKGLYEVNYGGKCLFHSLYEIEKNEPLTEHILAFDMDVEARTFEEARSKSYNKASEICDFLSVLVDVGIYEPMSTFSNFITTKMEGIRKCYAAQRYRTAFFDRELGLYVKDNMNGLCPKEELEKENFMNGYYSIAFYSSSFDGTDSISQYKIGDTQSVEKAFENHRIYKVQKNNPKGELSDNGIESCIHFSNQIIKIPREIRKYFRGISDMKDNDEKKFTAFRNASRLYNRSKVLTMNDASMEISLLVASVEALDKCEVTGGFTNFILKYNSAADRNELDDIYGIRSKFFHAGEFSFFEYNFDINPYSDPVYKEFQDKYLHYKSVIRSAIINWIKENILIEDK